LTAYHASRGDPRPVDVTAIGNWKSRGVPFERCVAIEVVTGGVVSRKETRPKDYLHHWPELATTETQGVGHG
jgi:DNA-binding transcriptional regulator YdaS (Cro superfamily)